MEAVQRFGWKDVKSIAQHVGTRTPTQVRTHAQKLFLRQQKETSGMMAPASAPTRPRPPRHCAVARGGGGSARARLARRPRCACARLARVLDAEFHCLARCFVRTGRAENGREMPDIPLPMGEDGVAGGDQLLALQDASYHVSAEPADGAGASGVADGEAAHLDPGGGLE
jgi:hypothetical protein